MAPLQAYASPETLPGTEAGRIGALLGLTATPALDDVALADRISGGLSAAAAEALATVVGRASVVGPLIPEATLRRAKKTDRALSREMSERLYEVGRVVDAVSRAYHGDAAAVSRFLNRPHRLLAGRTPMELAQSNSAGAEAVVNVLRRAGAGVAV